MQWFISVDVMDSFTNSEEWERVEERVLKNIPIKDAHNESEFRHLLIEKFFQERDERNVTAGQWKLGDELWKSLGDLYEAPKERERRPPSYINIDLKAYPREAKRFMFAIANYKGIFRRFNRGNTRKNLSHYYALKTKRKQSTVNRDISALVKMGILQRQGKGRYKANENAFV